MNKTTKSDSQSVKNESTESSIDYETTCGFGNWRPQWMQKFATPKFFVINFSVVAILQGAYFTYLIGSISTLEKRFAFESKMSGFILIADNLSQMVVSPIVGYLGSKYNRSHLIAVGELIVAVSCIISAFPYFIYGPGLHLLSNTNTVSNFTQYEVCSSDQFDPKCQTDSHSTVYLAVFLLWFASFANGLGYTAFYTIGLPYIDDNIKKKNSPLYISATATLRLCGPTLGFLLCSICLAWYEEPTFDPHIDRNDPRWVGAWWIGFLILGVSILIFTLPMFFFPKRFKGTPKDSDISVVTSVIRDPDEVNALEMSTSKTEISEMKIPKAKEVKIALKRLAKNPVLIFHAVGGIFRIFGYLGYYIFKPKYMEMQYRQSASGASFFTGSTSIVTMAIGIMGGGLLIRYFKPKPRPLLLYMFIVELIASSSIFTVMFFGCPTPIFPDTSLMDGISTLNLNAPNLCNTNCACTTRVYQPICASDGISTYFSPCYAGCKTIDRTTSPISFSDCQCIPSATNDSMFGTAQTGYCPTDCNNFPIFIIILSIGSMIASTARTGNTLITLRCVDPKDKSFAMGIIGSFFAVFAFIPYPLIFGAITDSACLVWEEFCGKTGNCWLYDIDKFRKYLHGAAFGFMIIGSLFDIGIIIMANRIKNLYGDEEEDDDKEDKQNRIQLLEKTNDRTNQFGKNTNNRSVVRNGKTTEFEEVIREGEEGGGGGES